MNIFFLQLNEDNNFSYAFILSLPNSAVFHIPVPIQLSNHILFIAFTSSLHFDFIFTRAFTTDINRTEVIFYLGIVCLKGNLTRSCHFFLRKTFYEMSTAM